jgi:hypothetical protein
MSKYSVFFTPEKNFCNFQLHNICWVKDNQVKIWGDIIHCFPYTQCEFQRIFSIPGWIMIDWLQWCTFGHISLYLTYKVEMWDVQYICVFIWMFTYSSRRDKPICTKLGMLILWDQEENIGGSKLWEKVSWVWFLERVVPVAWKLSTIEEQCEDQSCLFRRGD